MTNFKSKVAKTLDDCIVGPSSESERMDPGSEFETWKRQAKKKRSYSNHVGEGKEVLNGRSSGSLIDHAMDVFLSSGCCIIPNALPKKFVFKCKEKATADLQYLNAQRLKLKRQAMECQNEHLLARVARGDFRELVDRDGGRRDVRFQLDQPPFTSPGIVYNSMVFSLVKQLLGNGDVNLLYAGIMWALPVVNENGNGCCMDMDAASQKWHADGGHLFDHIHLPPHCINVFYPLVNLTKQNGPTDVLPGTHHHQVHPSSSSDPLSLCCQAGDAILFDYRLQHRGRANFTEEPRPILYLAYAKTFFRDAGNTRSGHSLVTPASLSPPWVSRILSGDPVPFGSGFDEEEWTSITTTRTTSSNSSSSHDQSQEEVSTLPNSSLMEKDESKKEQESEESTGNDNIQHRGSGERWILFKMNIELPNHSKPKVITVYHGDIAMEVSTQFCRENDLSIDFIPVLAESIQSQINAASMH